MRRAAPKSSRRRSWHPSTTITSTQRRGVGHRGGKVGAAPEGGGGEDAGGEIPEVGGWQPVIQGLSELYLICEKETRKLSKYIDFIQQYCFEKTVQKHLIHMINSVGTV